MGLPQLYVYFNSDLSIKLILVKVTDDLLVAGQPHHIAEFCKKASSRFKVSKVVLSGDIHFNGSIIKQHEPGNFELSMKEYLSGINSVHVTPSRRKESNSLAAPSEVDGYRRLCGELLWLGIGAVPHACALASSMQQRVPRLKVSDITWANRSLHHLHSSPASIRFRPPPDPVNTAALSTFSDASFNLHSSQSYGKSGYISGVTFPGTNIFHPVDWRSAKQRHVSYSSYGAEILACAEADDRGFYFKQGLTDILR